MGCQSCSTLGCNSKSAIQEVVVVSLQESVLPDNVTVEEINNANLYKFLATLDDTFMEDHERIFRAIGKIGWDARRRLLEEGRSVVVGMTREYIHYSPLIGSNVLVLTSEE